jgi:hypothetical protein
MIHLEKKKKHKNNPQKKETSVSSCQKPAREKAKNQAITTRQRGKEARDRSPSP